MTAATISDMTVTWASDQRGARPNFFLWTLRRVLPTARDIGAHVAKQFGRQVFCCAQSPQLGPPVPLLLQRCEAQTPILYPLHHASVLSRLAVARGAATLCP